MSVRRAGTAAIVASAALLSGVLAAPADAYIYWADNKGEGPGGSIGRANNDGTGVNPNFIPGIEDPCGVAVNGRHIFWASVGSSSIGRANLDRTGRNDSFIRAAGLFPCGPSVTPTDIWWANLFTTGGGDGRISRANLNGTNPRGQFAGTPNVDTPLGTGVNSTHVFWANSGSDSVWRSEQPDPIGTEDIASGSQASSSPSWPSPTNTHVYWSFADDTSGDRALVRRPVDGSGSTETLVPANAVGGVAVHAGKVYWSNRSEGTISRANLNGTGREFALVQPTPNTAGIAVDSERTPPTPRPTDCTGFEIGKADRNKKKGKATLPVEVPCAGSVELSGKGLKAASAEVEGAGEADLAVKAKGKTKKALRKKGRKKVKPEVAYTPSGGETQTETTKVKLVKK